MVLEDMEDNFTCEVVRKTFLTLVIPFLGVSLIPFVLQGFVLRDT